MIDLLDLAADGRLSAIVSEKGFGINARARAGAGAEARATLPITLDFKVIKLRVIPYANAHAGAGAEAHAAFEVEWSGKLRLDVGASLSTGVGAGAGVIIEIELGAMLKRALDRLIERIARLTRLAAPGGGVDAGVRQRKSAESRSEGGGSGRRAGLSGGGEVGVHRASVDDAG